MLQYQPDHSVLKDKIIPVTVPVMAWKRSLTNAIRRNTYLIRPYSIKT